MKNLKEQLTKTLYQNSFDGDSYHSYILFENMDKILNEQTVIAKEYAKSKCEELLKIVAEDLGNGSWYVNEYKVLENFNLDNFIEGTVSS